MQFCNNFYIYIMYSYTFNFCYLDAYFANNVCDLILIIRKKSFSSYFFVFSRHTSRIMFVFFAYLLFFILSVFRWFIDQDRNWKLILASEAGGSESLLLLLRLRITTQRADRICNPFSKRFKRDRVYTPTYIMHAPVYGHAYIGIYR